MAKMSKAESEPRFWEKASPEPNTGCWLWTGALTKGGYGVFQLLGRAVTASRLAWEYANGRELPAGSSALHSCDTPSCVNPEHLRPGSHLDNMRDRAIRGRACSGERHPLRVHPERARRALGESNPQAKITAADVITIRARAAAGEPQHVIAAAFGVSRSAVQLIAARKAWRHVA